MAPFKSGPGDPGDSGAPVASRKWRHPPGGDAARMGPGMRAALFCLLMTLFIPSPTRGQVEPSAWPEYAAYPFTPGLFWTDVGLSVLYDTNLELSQAPLEGPGLLADVRAQLRTSTRRPFARLGYRGQWRQYKASEQWNRDTHTFHATLDRRLGPLQFEGIGSWQIASQTEDREIADVYSVSPRLGLHFRSARLRAYGRYWARRFEQGSGQEEVIRTGGTDLQLKLFSFMEWQAGYRHEKSDSHSASRRYLRETFSAAIRLDLGARTTLIMEGARAERSYPERLVDVEGVMLPTEEIRWTPAVYIQQGSSQGPELRIGYEYQLRTSNDPRREFEAHRTVLSLRVPVFNWDRQPSS
jgi:hypothetical protein